MESPQSVESPFMISSMFNEPKIQNLDILTNNPSFITNKPEPKSEPESFLGVLDVHIHQARNIQNICIYHKQDVYAKICLTSNPENSITTRTINGGGNNPIFNQTLQVNVPTIDASLKCEVYMLSRVRNYLEDQLLGFTLIPLSEIIMKNGNLDKEFILSSSDLFHSPSGFVHLSFSYTGASPDIISVLPPPPTAKETVCESELAELKRIEFPDPKTVKENDMMVTKYFSLSSKSILSSDTDDQSDESSHTGYSVQSDQTCQFNQYGQSGQSDQTSQFGQTDKTDKYDHSGQSGQTDRTKAPFVEKVVIKQEDSPPTCVSSNEPPQHANKKYDSPANEKAAKSSDPEIKTANETNNTGFEQKVVQQDFVDLYMKSMQHFTESLAKMKLPLNVEKDGNDSGKPGSGQKIQTPNGRVFYGSRAFF